ncbi:hypothetical protein EJB05_02580, partial [Eragrostis curvula]
MAAGPRSAASIESGWPEQAVAASARGPGPPSGCGERAAMATVGLRLQFDLIARSAVAQCFSVDKLAGQLAGILLEDLDTEDIL